MALPYTQITQISVGKDKMNFKAIAALAVLTASSSMANAVPISETNIINNWTSAASPIGNSNNNIWSQSGNTVTNSNNTIGSLISDFTQSTDFTFSTQIRANNDNDLMGLVFGWQDMDNTYMLSWGGGGVPGIGYNGIYLTSEVGGVRTNMAFSSNLWSIGVTYDFTVGRTGDTIFASIDQGATNLFTANYVDTSFLSGNVGFTTYSQDSSFGFGNTDYSTRTVPEPSILALMIAGLIGFVGLARRKQPVTGGAI